MISKHILVKYNITHQRIDENALKHAAIEMLIALDLINGCTYDLDLVAPAEIDDEHFEQFHTELRELLKFIKYSKDKEKLDDVIHSDDTFKHISRKTADVINIVTGSELHYETGKDEVDMCKAIEDMRNDSIAIGEARGEVKGFLEAMISLVKDGILTVADAAKRANMTVAEFEEKTGLKA